MLFDAAEAYSPSNNTNNPNFLTIVMFKFNTTKIIITHLIQGKCIKKRQILADGAAKVGLAKDPQYTSQELGLTTCYSLASSYSIQSQTSL